MTSGTFKWVWKALIMKFIKNYTAIQNLLFNDLFNIFNVDRVALIYGSNYIKNVQSISENKFFNCFVILINFMITAFHTHMSLPLGVNRLIRIDFFIIPNWHLENKFMRPLQVRHATAYLYLPITIFQWLVRLQYVMYVVG